MKFNWQPNGKLIVFALLFLPLTIQLGFWQLSRAEEKRQLLAAHEARMQADYVVLNSLSVSQDQQNRRVRGEGQYDNNRVLLLDNRVRKGRPGYEVITLFQTKNGEKLLVNRGWVQAALDRKILPDIDHVNDRVELRGYLYRSPGKQIMLGEDRWQQDKPLQIVQNAAPDYAAERLGERFYPYHLRLDEASPGALRTGWTIVNVMPSKHTGYAVQWFLIATLLVVMSIFANSNLMALIRSRRRSGATDE